MSSVLIAVIAFVCLFGGALVGMAVRNALPQHHLSDDSRHLLGMALGVVGTMSGLVLGLLVASATGAYNAQRSEVVDGAARVLMLDRVLAHYGPEARSSREDLRSAVTRALTRLWPKERSSEPQIDPSAPGAEDLLDRLEALSPRGDAQRSLKSEAISLAIGLGQVQWLMYEQSTDSLAP